MALTDSSQQQQQSYNIPYSLTNLPEAGSDIVNQEKQIILGKLHNKDLVDYLREIETMTRIALYAATASGNATFQHQTRDLKNQLIEVYNTCGAAAQQFTLTARDVMKIVKTALGMISQGREQAAIKILALLSKSAKNASEDAEQLVKNVTNQQKSINDIIQQAVYDKEKARKQQEERTNSLKKIQEQLTSYKNQLQAEQNEVETKIANMKNKQDKIGKDLINHSSLWTSLYYFYSNSSILNDLELRKNRNQEELRESREDQKILKDRVRELNQKIVQNSIDQYETTERVYVSCLENLLQKLNKVSVTMQQTACFWRQIDGHCKYLASDQIQAIFQSTSPEELQLLQPFIQENSIMYYTKWLALHEVTSNFGDEICTARAGIWKQLEQAPTREEAIEALKGLEEKEISEWVQTLQI